MIKTPAQRGRNHVPEIYSGRLISLILFALTIAALAVHLASAVPVGPTVVFNSSETSTPASAAMINTTGGSITTVVLNATSQNLRWKAYVGNVSGRLTLDDAGQSTIFDWTLAAVVGEVYATRSSDTISWAYVNCSNQSAIAGEEVALNHENNPDDNISATFSTQIHDDFYVGSRLINQNTCYSLHPYINDSSQSDYFEEILLDDGTNIVYASILEQDMFGFDNRTYDFQMIVPEDGSPGFSGSTGYYFYVELG